MGNVMFYFADDLAAMIAGQIVAHVESANGDRDEFLTGMESMARGMCVTLKIEWEAVARLVVESLPGWVTALPSREEYLQRLSSP